MPSNDETRLQGDAATRLKSTPSLSSSLSSSSDSGRFASGYVLGGRYRIVRRLGRGGMLAGSGAYWANVLAVLSGAIGNAMVGGVGLTLLRLVLRDARLAYVIATLGFSFRRCHSIPHGCTSATVLPWRCS